LKKVHEQKKPHQLTKLHELNKLHELQITTWKRKSKINYLNLMSAILHHKQDKLPQLDVLHSFTANGS